MEKKKRKFQVSSCLCAAGRIDHLCAILTYIIPAGAYDMMTLEDGREVVNPETFHYIEQTPVGLMEPCPPYSAACWKQRKSYF